MFVCFFPFSFVADSQLFVQKRISLISCWYSRVSGDGSLCLCWPDDNIAPSSVRCFICQRAEAGRQKNERALMIRSCGLCVHNPKCKRQKRAGIKTGVIKEHETKPRTNQDDTRTQAANACKKMRRQGQTRKNTTEDVNRRTNKEFRQRQRSEFPCFLGTCTQNCTPSRNRGGKNKHEVTDTAIILYWIFYSWKLIHIL